MTESSDWVPTYYKVERSNHTGPSFAFKSCSALLCLQQLPRLHTHTSAHLPLLQPPPTPTAHPHCPPPPSPLLLPSSLIVLPPCSLTRVQVAHSAHRYVFHPLHVLWSSYFIQPCPSPLHTWPPTADPLASLCLIALHARMSSLFCTWVFQTSHTLCIAYNISDPAPLTHPNPYCCCLPSPSHSLHLVPHAALPCNLFCWRSSLVTGHVPMHHFPETGPANPKPRPNPG